MSATMHAPQLTPFRVAVPDGDVGICETVSQAPVGPNANRGLAGLAGCRRTSYGGSLSTGAGGTTGALRRPC